MTPALRATLARRWAETALDEHASIASFARHILELLALGAPADLVRAAQRAMAEEIDHAERCFRLASRFAGEPLGPGRLDATEATRNDPTAILIGIAREGCINETASVAAVSTVLPLVTDPECRDTLQIIIADETRHAQLAWKTLKWGLEAYPECREAIAAAFAEHRDDAPTAVAPDPELAAYGLLDEQAERAAMAVAMVEVVRPAWRALER